MYMYEYLWNTLFRFLAGGVSELEGGGWPVESGKGDGLLCTATAPATADWGTRDGPLVLAKEEPSAILICERE